MKNLLVTLLCTFSIGGFTNIEISISQFEKKEFNLNYSSSIEHGLNIVDNRVADSNITKTKLIAISLAITLGAFGVHRLYLGTKPLVPLAYTLTLGGGFLILPVIDIIYILFAKDLEDIQQNNHVFIWNKKKKSVKVTEN